MKTKRFWVNILLWCAINLALSSCKSNQTGKTDTPPSADSTFVESPKPISEPQTDSLKRVLDRQRENRLKQH